MFVIRDFLDEFFNFKRGKNPNLYTSKKIYYIKHNR